MRSKKLTRRKVGAGAALVAVSLTITACAGAGGSGSSSGGGDVVTLTFASVNTPQFADLQEMAVVFEKENQGIKIDFIQMSESDLRDAVTADIATNGGQYDILTIGSYEVPIWGDNGWLADLTDRAVASNDYDVEDFLEPVRKQVTVEDSLYAVPFYAESSFLMYNKEILDAAGLTVPEHPTWDEVAAMARQVQDSDTTGICLRGKPGWGEGIVPLTTMAQTFGGGWYDENWNAGLNEPEFIEAVQFYADLLKDAGEKDPVSFGFTECLNLFSQGKAAFWYDATSAGGLVETPELSDVAGKVGFAHAPVRDTAESGWLWSWNLAIPASSEKQDAAWAFMEWATSKEYVQHVGETLGWGRIPSGGRESTFALPEYQEAGASFADLTHDIMLAVNPDQPGVSPQPYVGIQYVTIPEFQDLGNQVSQLLAEVYAGRSSVEDAMNAAQKLAQEAAPTD
ncbi:ABC transporter substrate-binding protein [Microbacterium sp. YY-01]|uniref:ABC transporter substrate-binding protein n=1 Tax=Microbacterium sp. YY-01 TaxID=3421634 RepID=UPI003D176461